MDNDLQIRYSSVRIRLRPFNSDSEKTSQKPKESDSAGESRPVGTLAQNGDKIPENIPDPLGALLGAVTPNAPRPTPRQGRPPKGRVILPADRLPDCIAGIPGIQRLEESGGYLYFLCRDGRVVYVGQTVSIPSRAQSHRKSKCAFDAVYYAYIPDLELLLDAERECIRILQPEWNNHGIKGKERYRRPNRAVRPEEPLHPLVNC